MVFLYKREAEVGERGKKHKEECMIESKVTSLFLITAYNKKIKQENIIFSNFKEEMSAEEENALIKEVNLLEDKDNIYYQRFFVMEKSTLKKKYLKLIKEKNIELFGKKYFLKCELKEEESKTDHNTVEGYKKDERYLVEKYSYGEYCELEDTEFLYINEEFTKGFKEKFNRGKSNLIFPFGYILTTTLDNLIKSKICIRYEELFFISYLRGREENKDLEPEKYIGEINYAPIDLNKIAIVISKLDVNIEKLDDKMWIKVDNKTGKWEYNLEERMAKGIIGYKNIETNEILAVSKFYLMMKFDLNMSVLDKGYTDLYGEKISYSGNDLKENKGNTLLKSKTFFKKSYPNHDEKKYSKEISKYLENVFEIMGEEIYIVDPYLLGKLEKGKVNFSQKALINAIFKTLTKVKLKKICFIGSIKTFKEKKETYSKLMESIKKIQKIECKIILLNRKFHDRYIMGAKTKKVVSITASANGLAKNGEVTFNIIQESDAKKVLKQYQDYVKEKVKR